MKLLKIKFSKGLEKSKIFQSKAVLFTLGLFFLAITVFSLAIVLFHVSLKSEDVFFGFVFMDRLSETDISLQNSIKDIFNAKSGMSISATSSTVSFQDYLPNQNKNQLISSLNNFENYVESSDSSINIDMAKIVENTSLVILPYNITYKHLFFGDNMTNIIPSEDCNITSYVIYLDTRKVNFTTYSWDIVPSGSNTFELNVQDDQGNSDSDTYSIGDSDEHIMTVETLAGDIKIKIWNSSNLFVNNTAELNLSIRTDITFEELPNEETSVILSGDIINIDFSDFGIKKKSGVRLI